MPLGWLSQLNMGTARFATAICAALLLAITAVVVVSVFFRYVVNSSLSWSEELTRYLAVWLVFLGMAPAYRAGEHVRVGFFVDRFSPGLRRGMYVVAEVLILTFATVVAWEGWHLAEANFERNQLTPALRIPIGWVYTAIPIGMGFMALQSLERLVRLIRERAILPPEPPVSDTDVIVPSA